MKLLFDQNISRVLVGAVGDVFPGSTHVALIGLETASDREVWDFAKKHGFAIVSKDADFHQLGFLLGAPPKTIWLRLGNCTTTQIIECLLRNRLVVLTFHADPSSAVLVLGR